MILAFELEPAAALPPVEYRWDADTEILSAALADGGRGAASGASGAIEVEGVDGSWLTLELSDGCLGGVQVAVWPRIRERSGLAPPAGDGLAPVRARVTLPEAAPGEVVSLEVSAPLSAEADPVARLFHFRLGRGRAVRHAAIAADLLVELDERRRLTGLWLLNVPPCPESA